MFGNSDKDENNNNNNEKITKRLIDDVLEELTKARKKFPEQNTLHTLAALTEEIGELNQAILHYNFEPEKHVNIHDIRKEAIQSIVMVMRVLLDTNLKA